MPGAEQRPVAQRQIFQSFVSASDIPRLHRFSCKALQILRRFPESLLAQAQALMLEAWLTTRLEDFVQADGSDG